MRRKGSLAEKTNANHAAGKTEIIDHLEELCIA
jgi:hypothetical protein